MTRSTTPKDNVAAFRASMDYISNHDGLQPERSRTEKLPDAPGHPVGDGMKRTQEIMERMSRKPGDNQ